MMQGARVLLRPMDKADTDDVLCFRGNPEVLAQLFSDEPPTRQGHLGWLEQIQAQGVRQEFMIVERSAGRSIGTIGLNHIDPKHHRAEFGILIGDAAARGRGLAFEAGRLLLDYAYNKLGLRRLYLHVFPDNEPALHLYRKLGFIQEGILRKHVVKNGKSRDVVVMAVLRGAQRD